jgi:hypothetical protein
MTRRLEFVQARACCAARWKKTTRETAAMYLDWLRASLMN